MLAVRIGKPLPRLESMIPKPAIGTAEPRPAK